MRSVPPPPPTRSSPKPAGLWAWLCAVFHRPCVSDNPSDTPYLNAHPDPDKQSPAEERFTYESEGSAGGLPDITHTWRW